MNRQESLKYLQDCSNRIGQMSKDEISHVKHVFDNEMKIKVKNENDFHIFMPS